MGDHSDAKTFQIHGDNIVECIRVFDYIVSSLGGDAIVAGPALPVTCPVYTVKLQGHDLVFQCLPGYGESRWNQDILAFIQQSGGRLREATDAILTLKENGTERPIVAIEFCGALPAGNQAWQRQGRAFSYAHAGIPFFYIAELGGFELDADRTRTNERMPNPAVPFSFFAMTQYHDSICLPVYEANPGANIRTTQQYGPIFGKPEFLEILKRIILGHAIGNVAQSLSDKCVALVKLLADSKKRQDGLTSEQWQAAHDAMLNGQSFPEFLINNAQLPWKKKAYIKKLTKTAKRFMELGATESLGLSSSTLPLSLIPKQRRSAFSKRTHELYPDLDRKFVSWLANSNKHLAITWVMGFKPRGDDARPDRGLPPLTRMLIGDSCNILTFVYGPAPKTHWKDLAKNPVGLANRNGLWEAILSVSDGILSDSATKPSGTPRGYLKHAWAAILHEKKNALSIKAEVLRLSEQDVDTALHIAFDSLGADIVFEGMCNPPGGDWSGVSFRWGSTEPEHRWLTLPRVSASNAKRPDHVFALFGHGDKPVCLCIESKEHAKALDANIGPRLIRYTKALFACAPNIQRSMKPNPWQLYDATWVCGHMAYLSAGAYLAHKGEDPFSGLPAGTGLDIQIGVAFSADGQACRLHLRGDTSAGRKLAAYLHGQPCWAELVTLHPSN